MSEGRFYAYEVTEVTGNQVGKTEVGEFLIEREYKGNGSYTWQIFNFKRKEMPVVATITGRYVGMVTKGRDGRLDEESRGLLAEASRGS